MNSLRHYRGDLIFMVLIGLVMFLYLGITAIPLFMLLVVVEISLSGDNATVNVKLLKLMTPGWVLTFMTLGILIAAGFMRFLFPIIMVWLNADLTFGQTLHMAIFDHDAYQAAVLAIDATLATLGGTYLLQIGLHFFTQENDDRDGHWWKGFEGFMLAIGDKLPMFRIIVTAASLLAVALNVEASQRFAVLVAGLVALGSYELISGLADFASTRSVEYAEEHAGDVNRSRGAAWIQGFVLFIALEFQDAAFSFDGVAGALAITNNPVIIAGGLGVGALFVRSATKHLLKVDALTEYRYLENGAYYAILILAVSQLASPFMHIPGYGYWVGIISVALIIGSTVHSHILNKREGTGEDIVEEILGADIKPEGFVRKDEGASASPLKQ